jgi:excisionase family DNA binding protein
MERIPHMIALTSTEAATLLDVHPSTVKRWCNEGELDSELTPGGHRRISIRDAMGLARDRGIPTVLTPFHPFESHVWSALQAIVEQDSYRELIALAMQWTRQGEFDRLERLYLALGRHASIPFQAFCDRAVRGLLAEVGHDWAKGKLRVGDEHMVTQAITGALFALRREWMAGATASRNGHPDERPVAVVGTLEGNQHALGALCVRILLERAGWHVFYPGPDVPIDDFGVIQKSREASLVCVSLPAGGSLGDVARTLSSLRAQYDLARPYAVAFGGTATATLEGQIHEDPFESVGFYPDCASVELGLAAGLGATASARPAGAS